MLNQTLLYYNENAKKFTEGTLYVDFSYTQNKFLSRLVDGAKILDFGCGSGRDTKYFLEKGYEVEAIDGSEELCKIASAYTGVIQKMEAALKAKGIIYTSFKYGNFEGERNSRYFTDMTEERMKKLNIRMAEKVIFMS